MQCIYYNTLNNTFLLPVFTASATSDNTSLPSPLQTQPEDPPLQRDFYKMVIMKIPARWKEFGVFLDIEIDILTKVEREHMTDLEAQFLEVYRIWKSQTPSPFTWKTVIDVLGDMKENRLVKEIKKHLGIPH